MRYFVVLTFIFTSAACSMDPGTGMNNLDSASNTPSAEDFEKSLQGTWERGCSYDSQNGYYKEDIAFAGTGGNFGIIYQDYFFSDANCVNPSFDRMESLTVMDITNDGNLWNYTATVASQTVTPRTQAAAATLNAGHACGISSWAAGVSLDTTSTGCNSVSSLSDTLSLGSGSLFRALDEVKNSTVVSGSVLQGAPYHRVH